MSLNFEWPEIDSLPWPDKNPPRKPSNKTLPDKVVLSQSRLNGASIPPFRTCGEKYLYKCNYPFIVRAELYCVNSFENTCFGPRNNAITIEKNNDYCYSYRININDEILTTYRIIWTFEIGDYEYIFISEIFGLKRV